MMGKIGHRVRLVDIWMEMIADLYRAGGWWNEIWIRQGASSGVFFAVTIDSATGRAVEGR